MRAPVSLCLIVKNEPLLEECLSSIRNYVEEIVIVDTGSTDNTPNVAKKYADTFEVYTLCNNPETGLIEDFAQARQRSFELASKPWVLWLDADDIMVGAENLLALTKEFDAPRQDIDSLAYLFRYEYSYDETGECNLSHFRERLIYDKSKYHWCNPVHEVLIPNEGARVAFLPKKEVVIKHRRQYGSKKVEIGRNLRILRKYYEKVGETDARQLYYLGLECCNNGFVDESIKLLTRYIEISGWEDERVMACLKLVDIYQALGQFEELVKWGFKAIEIKENWAEGYFALAKGFYFLAMKGGPNELRNWQRCAHFAKAGLILPPTQTLLFINPLERDVEIHKYLNMALNKLGDVQGALDSVNTGLKRRPTEPFLTTNKRFYEVFIAKKDMANSIQKLKDVNEITDIDVQNIFSILNKQTLALTNEKPRDVTLVQTNSATVGDVTVADKLDVIFFAGNGIECYTPETIKKTGIGGSELMLSEMSKRLASLGHKVRVYNSCGDGEGVYDGVQYLRTEKFQNLECDVLIASRNAQALDDSYSIKSKIKLLWVHDLYIANYKNELALRADKILALSDFHKNLLIQAHNLHPSHIIKTRNGIDLKRFVGKNIKRERYKCINSSSPDRSWAILLSVWGKIKERVPGATLTLAYGWKNWEYSSQWDKLQQDLIQRLKNQIEELKPLGVDFIGRVSQERLAEEMLSSSVSLHPTWFQETSGITFMENQAAGLRIVSSAIGALNETIADRGILINGIWTDQSYQKEFIEIVVRELTSE